MKIEQVMLGINARNIKTNSLFHGIVKESKKMHLQASDFNACTDNVHLHLSAVHLELLLYIHTY